MHLIDDSRRFWRRTILRGTLLLASCALIIALTAVNTVVLRSSLWFTPPGVDESKQFVTLGQYTPDGKFAPVSRRDLLRLRELDATGEYAAYGVSDADIRWGSRKWARRDVALVSDNFFDLLGVDATIGTTLNPTSRGLVLSYEFWHDQLLADPGIVGRSISIDAMSLPVLGVAAQGFEGLGDSQPIAWLSNIYTPAFFDLVLPLPDEIISAVKQEFAQEVPFYYGLLQSKHSRRALSRLDGWKVRDTVSISLRTPNGPLVLGFDARGHKPAVLPRVDLNPDKTSVVSRYLAALAVLNTALAFLALLNLASFWAARTSERSQELQTLVAVGARRSDLLHLFISEAVPFLLLILMLSIPLAAIQLTLLRSTEPFNSYLAARGVSLGWEDFLPGILLLTGIATTAVALPWLYLRDNVLRSRSVGVTVAAKRARIATTWLQWLLSAVVAAAVAASFLVGTRLSNASWGGRLDPLLLSMHGVDGNDRGRLLSLLSLDPMRLAVLDTAPLTPLQIRNDSYLIEGSNTADRHSAYFNRATPNAFEALGLRFLHGRTFESRSENEVVLSAAAAKRFDAAIGSLVGKHIVRMDSLNVGNDKTYTVVGVVENVRYNDVRSVPEAVAYIAMTENTSAGTVILSNEYKTKIANVRRSLAGEPELSRVLDEIRPVSDVLAEHVRTELLLSIFTFAYAALALAMMCLGLLAQARTQLSHQGRELALRVALGASLGRITREFVKLPFIVALYGVVPVLVLVAISVGGKIFNIPMIHSSDWLLLAVVITATILAFCTTLLLFVRRRLARYNLSELLRIER